MFELPGYRVLRELGRGGTAVVYLAEQESLKRPVALKVLKVELAPDPDFSERFLREGRLAASLRHRHIVTIFDVGLHAGRPYLAFDYFERGSVAHQLPLPAATALRCTAEIALALDFAHARGVIHRDVKPDNILCADDGGFALSDFGIARAVASTRLTQEGLTLGTPAYMAPEQWRGASLDGRADLYSLGVVLFQLLTGRLPYEGEDAWALGMQHVQAPLPLLPQPYAELQGLLARMLAKDPDQRAPNGRAIHEHIASLLREHPWPGQPATDRQAARPPPRPRTSRLLQEWPHAVAQPAPSATPVVTAAPTSAHGKRYRRGLALIALALIALVAWDALGPPFGPGTTAQDSRDAGPVTELPPVVAVLPCQDFSGQGDDIALGEVVAIELTNRLALLKGLAVIARESVKRAGANDRDLRSVAKALGASHLITCALRPSGENLRISAELIEGRSQTQLWTSMFERRQTDMLTGIDEIAVGLAEQLLARLLGSERASLLRSGASSLSSIRRVEQAALLIDSFQIESMHSGMRILQEVAREDPGFPRAYVEQIIGLINLAQMEGTPEAEFNARVGVLLDKLHALNTASPEAWVLRAYVEPPFTPRRSSNSLALARQAVLMAPGSARVMHYAAQTFLGKGRVDEAIAAAERARELDPLNPFNWQLVAASYRLAGRIELAVMEHRRALEMFPDDPINRTFLALALVRQGACKEGLQEFEQAMPRVPREFRLEFLAIGASAARCAGQPGIARTLRDELFAAHQTGSYVSPVNLAAVELATDQIDAAVVQLEAAFAARDWRLAWALHYESDFGFDRLDQHAGYQALKQRIDALSL